MADAKLLVGLAADFDRTGMSDYLEQVAADRQRVEEYFPLADWPELALDEYALGPDSPNDQRNFCRMMEYGTEAFGSIRGGSAAKHIIYQHRSGEWRLPAPLKRLEPQRAWGRIRQEFESAFAACRDADFEALDDLETLAYGQALVTKALTVYFPTGFLPIFSAHHIRHFADILGDGADLRGMRTWQANRVLHEIVYDIPVFAGWDAHEVMYFLYEHADPRQRERDIWKISPGRQAEEWERCLADQAIRVSWGAVGDLTQYESDTELKAELDRVWPDRAGGHLRLARQLLAFRDLERGDTVIANRGKSHVLALGTVNGGYVYQPEHEGHAHTVPVVWDTSYEQTLDAPENAWQSSFARVPASLLRKIRAVGGRATVSAPEVGGGFTVSEVPTPPGPPLEPFALSEDAPTAVRRVVDLLQRYGQVILHGPPGTGKTRLAFSTALALADQAHLVDAPAATRDAAVVDLLESGAAHRVDVELVTFHPSYGYEDFVEGFKPDLGSDATGLRLALKDGMFMRLCADAAAAPDRTVLLVVDEINRGDLPRILGELVTVLEKGKRGYPVTLPTSGRRLVVPRNLWIIGTMNTADRSIGHLDAAIRRRFGFVEVPPDSEAVAGNAGALDLAVFLEGINARISRELGADHRLGHSCLLGADDQVIDTEAELAMAFYHRIVPFLDDLCLGRGDLLHGLLGGGLVDAESGRVAQMNPQDLATALASEFIDGEDTPSAE